MSGRCWGDGESSEGNVAKVWENQWDAHQCQQSLSCQTGEGEVVFDETFVATCFTGKQWFQEAHSECCGDEERSGEHLQETEEYQTETEQADARSIQSCCWT